MANNSEVFISVDVESSGPIPGDYSMLSLGACVVGSDDQSFYVEFKPLNDNAVPDAMTVTGFDLATLVETGADPEDAMKKLAAWVKDVAGDGKPVFVGFNAGFDWSFVNWYFNHFLKKNPFGFAPLDVKSYYMGMIGCSWEETKSSRIRTEYLPTVPGDHNALHDARAQAEMFAKMREGRATQI
ncbi:exonuclease domain-containing protein [Anatilimnocola sp. NA78]|uniref:3'-5' exonuclease n=1 Tax=Anatilimnocola sp. NA78 TaxID=3415683 RepID=UPI003CE5A9C7